MRKKIMLIVIILVYYLYNDIYPFSILALQFTDYGYSEDKPNSYYYRQEQLDTIEQKGLSELIEYINNNNFYDKRIKIVTRRDLKRMKKEMENLIVEEQDISGECYSFINSTLSDSIHAINKLLRIDNIFVNQINTVRQIISSIDRLQKTSLNCL